MADTRHDVIVIGCGVAGLSAARHALKAGLSVAAMESLLFGGLIINVNELDGEIKGSGSEFASGLMEEALDLGLDNLCAQVVRVERTGDGLLVTSDSGVHAARAVIVASGARLKKLGLAQEEAFEHKGLSHCADCDGPMLSGKVVAVVGGGDSALQSALTLAGYCRQVHLIHRDDVFGGQSHLAQAVPQRSNIDVHMATEVRSLLGSSGLDGLQLHDRCTGQTSDLPVDALFVFVGLEPASEFVPDEVERDAHGFLVTDAARQTRVAAVYAAGAIRSGCGGTISDAMHDGTAAAQAVLEALAVPA